MRILNDLDRRSDTWKKIKAHYEAELAKLRQQNDGELDAEKTARLRGRIFEIKRILDMDKETPVRQVEQI